MQWSSNHSSIVKNSAVKPGEGKEIVTKVEVPQVIDPKEAELLSEEERRFAKNNQRLAKIELEHKQKLAQMEKDSLAKAKKEAEVIQQKAQEQGYKAGQHQGYQDGYQAGLNEAQKIIDQEQKNLNQTTADCQRLAQEKEAQMREFSIKMAEVLLKKQLELKPEMIVDVINPVLVEFEKPDEMLIIRANSRYHEPLSDRMEKMHQEIPNLRYSVLDDDALGLGEVKLESNESFVTVDIQKELELFLQSLDEKDKED